MNKGKRFYPQALSSKDLRALLYWSDSGAYRGARRKAIFTVLWQTGARRNECCKMIYPDHVFPIDDGTMIIRIETPKGCNKRNPDGTPLSRPIMPREVGIGKVAAQTIREWIAKRGERRGPLFPTSSWAHMVPGTLNQMVDRVAKDAGIERRCTPHSFRHTFARKLYDSGMGLLEIMQALGHHNINTTQIYLQNINATDVATLTSGVWDDV